MEIAVSVKNIIKKYKLYEDKWGPVKEILLKKNLHKEFLALNNVSLDFPKGESIGVLGKNGSGKSTLLKIITGITDPTSGSVEVNGSLVFLDVSSGIDPELSGYENIFMKGTLLGYTKEEMMSKVDDIIEFSELGEFINQPVKNYSSGMRSKLGFAISVNVDPDILIVDEALAVGDSMFRQKCMDKMNEFKDLGKTIIFVSHDHNAVESFCSKAAWIHEGNLITYGESKQVSSYYHSFMSGRKTMEEIKMELNYHHSLETAELKNNAGQLSIELSGYVYNDEENQIKDWYFVTQNARTKEKKKYLLNRMADGQVKGKFTISLPIFEDLLFYSPGQFTFEVGHLNNDGKLVSFPIWSENVDFISEPEINHQFKYELLNYNQSLIMKIFNIDKLEEQVNRIYFEGNYLMIDGVAFVRGYETPSGNEVDGELYLVHKETFEYKNFPITFKATEEITENQSFNPLGKNYTYSRFISKVDLSELSEGEYECKIRYSMNRDPLHVIINQVWASKNDQYDLNEYQVNDKSIQIVTKSKHLYIIVSA
ncbi:ABC transporter ATP-binding protein [Lysinibacillus halotolerans]|uniref:ABC transporter ATP-binding protein n=1 Tax=Lysinibacillus halotolerans TaxID=1368476 RepID=UPI00131463DD|nr:ABC transporter ATP-binding protein [Lysinibacillus halotolerans]